MGFWSVDGQGPVLLLVIFLFLFGGACAWWISADLTYCKEHPSECEERRARLLCEEQDDDADYFLDLVLP